MGDARTDAELLERWRDGDTLAGGELFDRYVRRLSRFFGNKVDLDAEELIQRTFLAAVEGRDRVRSASSFPAYLFAIARRELYAHFRRRAAHPDLDIDEVSVHELARTPASVVDMRREQRLVLEALRRIPLPYQVTIELHYWEDMTTAEVAEVMSVPEPTVCTRLRRGRKLIEQQLAALADSHELLDCTTRDLEAWARSLREHVG